MDQAQLAFFGTPPMAALFTPEAHIAALLGFEAALARAEARAGLIPAEAAAAIAERCRVELYDVAALYAEAARAGTPAIPLVAALSAQVGEHARRFVHWGATSQDAIDTALALQMRAGVELLRADLRAVADRCAALAEQHRHTPMAGRTLLQQALPISFGLKAARWLALALRLSRELGERAERSLTLQFGGAVGTLAALGDQGLAVAALLAEELGLPAPELPWHAERDRVALLAATLGVVAGSLAKVAGDIALLAQTEVGEAAEGVATGKGGSSTLPQKRNPVDATMARAAAHLALAQVPLVLAALEAEHERAAGGWQAEWQALPDLFRFSAGALARVRDALDGLTVDPERMRANLELGGGLLMAESLVTALAASLGRHEAARLVRAVGEHALAAGLSLREAALADAQVAAALSPEAIEQALEPTAYLGSADVLIDRALAAYRQGL
jgi:3-carboxy-cis,cis-muconate cycloisomerase